MKELLAVTKDHKTILFKGTRKECYQYMKSHSDWDDLRYMKQDESGIWQLWRCSSYILD
jgi:hypothetical protein